MDEKYQSKCDQVIIFNHLEGYFDILCQSAVDEFQAFRTWAGHGDHSLFWLGESKLVITSYPIIDADLICQCWGYRKTQVAAPEKPSYSLSLDILREDHLIRAILEQAGPSGVVELVPYVTTEHFYRLVNQLRDSYGLEVRLPESPAYENLWLRDYVDTKAGFRDLVIQWVDRPEILPEGVVVPDVHLARPVIKRFLLMGEGCVVKSNRGVNGMGNLIINRNRNFNMDEIGQLLEGNSTLQNDQVIVERYISSPDNQFPSLEIYIPLDRHRSPGITYLSQQIFDVNGHFEGLWVGRELLEAAWYPELAGAGIQIAERLKQRGYVGHFDLDAIIDKTGTLYLLEINARRTGGTHVHEFAYEKISPSYLQEVVLLNYSHIPCKSINGFRELESQLGDLFFPTTPEKGGVVITSTSKIREGSIGCIFIGESLAKARSLEQLVKQRIAAAPLAKDGR